MYSSYRIDIACALLKSFHKWHPTWIQHTAKSFNFVDVLMDMIEYDMTGKRQSLYTSRPRGLKPLN